MTWVKLDDHFDEHPKFAAVGPLGVALFVCALAYSNRNLTDGFVPRTVARTLVDWTVPDSAGTPWRIGITAEDRGDALGGPGYDVDGEMVANVLLEHGLFEKAPGGYRIHDYDHFQPSKERVLAERKAASDRMQKVRSSRRSPEHHANNGGTSDEVQEKFEGSSPYPVPVPVPREEEKSPNGDSSVSTKRDLSLNIRTVLTYANTTLGHKWKLLEVRKTKIRARFNEGYTVADLCKAVDGVLLDPWDGRTIGGNDDPKIIFRDGAQVDKFIALADGRANGFRPESEEEREERIVRELAARGPRT